MKKNAILLAALGIFTMAFALVAAAQAPAKVDGSWDLTMQGPNGGFTQTVVFQQDGNKIKGTAKGRRGESPLEGTIDGNKIQFKITRQTPNGEQRTVEYTGTVDGDSIKGTMKMGDTEREWTAKRSQPNSNQ